MFKKFLFVLICLAFIVGATSSAALAGPPWPPEVVTPPNGKEGCVMPWIAWVDGFPTIIVVNGTISWVYQPKTGVWNLSCHLFIDFDDPSMATIAEVCAIDPGLCVHGPFNWSGFECYGGYDLYTTDTSYVVNPSGHALGVCHFNPMKP